MFCGVKVWPSITANHIMMSMNTVAALKKSVVYSTLHWHQTQFLTPAEFSVSVQITRNYTEITQKMEVGTALYRIL